MATFNSRIILKHDTEQNWEEATSFVPKKGELIIYTPDDTHSYPRIKVGDEQHIPKDLPFLTNNDFSNENQNKLASTNLAYGTCSTDAATAVKTVTLQGNDNWELKVGSIIMVKFTNTNSAANAKLDVNGTGAKSIWYNNAVYTTASSMAGYAKRCTMYVYDGTYWVFIAHSYDANSDTKVTSTNTKPSNEANWYPISSPKSATETAGVVKTDNIKFKVSTGTATTVGRGGIVLGNPTASGNADNAAGDLVIYSSSTGYIKVIPETTPYAVIQTLPAKEGTILNSGTIGAGLSWTNNLLVNSGVRTISSGTNNGTISVNTNGTNTEVEIKGLGTAAYTDSTAYDVAGAADEALDSAKEYTDEVKNELLNGAGGAYDTLKELGDLIDTNTDAIDALEQIAAGKQNTITGAATTVVSNDLTANRAVIANSNGKIDVSSVTSTELGYVSGVTSSIQTQLDGKAPKSHAVAATTYGAGSGSNYGHVKLSDSTSSTSAAAAGIAASPKAVKAAYDAATNAANNSIVELSVSGTTITYTRGNGTTSSVTTQDTTYTAITNARIDEICVVN